MDKRGQQIFGMQFGVIFSVILIVFFIVAAFIAIKIFWNPSCDCSFSDQSQEGLFKDDLQTVINDVWNSAGADRAFKIRLPSKIEYVCFMDFYNTGMGEKESFLRELKKSGEANVYLYPSKCACSGFKTMEIKHINITETTKSENPLCIKNGQDAGIKSAHGGLVVVYEK